MEFPAGDYIICSCDLVLYFFPRHSIDDSEIVVIDQQEATIRINKRRDIIQNMAVEMASLRQELLGKQLSNKKETDMGVIQCGKRYKSLA